MVYWSPAEEYAVISTVLYVIQLIVSVLLIGLVLLQVRGSGIGRTFGSDTGSIHRTRRGLEKTIFQFTIVTAVAFVVVSMLSALAVT
jgi:preprotein translocase subunit SecG